MIIHQQDGGPAASGARSIDDVFGSSVNTKGRLLVATPVLDDPNFARVVIYVIEHHDDGALGLVLNRPSVETLGEPLDRWVDVQSEPSQVFTGGPVEPEALIALAKTVGPAGATAADGGDEDDPDSHLSTLNGTIASADLAADPALVAADIDGLRVFRGYAGWGAGQLEAEIGTGSWIVVDSLDDDIFTATPGELWRRVLGRQPGRLGWLANAPDDLAAN